MNRRFGVAVVALAAAVCMVSAAYEANWASLSQNELPEWMKDAKFGIYTHWSVFSVPAEGGPDYVKNLYGGPEKDAKGIYSHHL